MLIPSKDAFKYILTVVVMQILGQELNAQDTTELNVNAVRSMSLQELMEQTVTVSSTIPQDIFETPSTVTIIDRQMMEDYDFLCVAEALSAIAGIDVYQTIMDRNIPTIRGVLQNFYSSKILLLINGVATWQPIYGEGYIDRLDIKDIDRIEILKGPASVIYGSNAYSGVINLVLNQEPVSGVRSYMRTGSPSLGAVGLNIAYSKKDFFISLHSNTSYEKQAPYELKSISSQSYNGDTSFIYNPEFNGRNITAHTQYKNHALVFNGFDLAHTFMGAAPSYLSGGGTFMKHKGILVNYRYDKPLGDRSRLLLNATYDYYNRFHPLSYDRDLSIALEGDRAKAEMKFNTLFFSKLYLELGSDYELRHSRGHDTRGHIRDTLMWHNFEGDRDIFESSGFAQLKYQLGKWYFQAGSRYTYNSLYYGNLSSRFAALLHLNKHHSIKFLWGESFRAPTLFELFFSNGHYVVSNPNLLPETSSSYELAYLSGFRYLYFQVLFYHANYQNLITRFTPVPGQPQKYGNTGQFSGFGSEVEIKYHRPGIFSSYLNYNYMDGSNTGDELNFQYVPDHSFSLGLTKQLQQFSLASNVNYVSRVKGHFNTIDSYQVLNFVVGYEHLIDQIKCVHKLSLKNALGDPMLTPEYIRRADYINEVPMTSPAAKVVYSLSIDF